MTTQFILNGKGKDHKYDKIKVGLTGHRCIGPCPQPIITAEGTTQFQWSDENSWKSFRPNGAGIPAAGESWHLPAGFHLIYNL